MTKKEEKIKSEKKEEENLNENKQNNQIESEINFEEKVKLLEKELIETKNDYFRARADYENFRKRKEIELAETKDRVIINFVEDLLPSIENFEMSLKMTDNKEMFIKGVEMIHKNLTETLKAHKFESFEPKIGEEFNPYHHEAILIEDKTQKPNLVISVIKKGYKHKDKIVKPAKVTIVKEEEEKSEK